MLLLLLLLQVLVLAAGHRHQLPPVCHCAGHRREDGHDVPGHLRQILVRELDIRVFISSFVMFYSVVLCCDMLVMVIK
jgi:hypothetical protein